MKSAYGRQWWVIVNVGSHVLTSFRILTRLKHTPAVVAGHNTHMRCLASDMHDRPSVRDMTPFLYAACRVFIARRSDHSGACHCPLLHRAHETLSIDDLRTESALTSLGKTEREKEKKAKNVTSKKKNTREGRKMEWNYIKISPVAAELFHADRRADETTWRS